MSVTVHTSGNAARWRVLFALAPSALLKCPHIRHLTLRIPVCPGFCCKPAADLLIFARTLHTAELHDLYLGSGDMIAFTSAHWQQCPVTRLALLGLRGTPTGMQHLCDGLRHCLRLQSLEVGPEGAGVGEEGAGLRFLSGTDTGTLAGIAARLSKLPRLRRVAVRGWQLPAVHSPRSAASAWVAAWHCDLTALVLTGVGLDDGWAGLLAPQLAQIRQLEVLDLSGNRLGIGGVCAIGNALRRATALRDLRLRGSFADADGILELAAALRAAASPRSAETAEAAASLSAALWSPPAAAPPSPIPSMHMQANALTHACASPESCGAVRSPLLLQGPSLAGRLASICTDVPASPSTPGTIPTGILASPIKGAVSMSTESARSAGTPAPPPPSPTSLLDSEAQPQKSLGEVGDSPVSMAAAAAAAIAGTAASASAVADGAADLPQRPPPVSTHPRPPAPAAPMLPVPLRADNRHPGSVGEGLRRLRVLDVSGGALTVPALDAVGAAVAGLQELRDLVWDELAALDECHTGSTTVVPHAADMLCTLCSTNPELTVRGGDAHAACGR